MGQERGKLVSVDLSVKLYRVIREPWAHKAGESSEKEWGGKKNGGPTLDERGKGTGGDDLYF